MSDHEIRDAVRQLGRAVGTLARAVVGAVRRTRSAAAARPTESGPPQEWLDLVAETDPDWLARSSWADRARRASKDRARSFGGGRRASAARTEPSPPPSPTEGLWPDAVPLESGTAPMRRPVRTTSADGSTRPAGPAAQGRRGLGTEPQLPRLLPVDPAGEAAEGAQADPPRRVRPTGPAEETTQDGQGLDSGWGTQAGAERPTRAERPLDGVRNTAADVAAQEQAPLRPYRPSDALRPVPIEPLPDRAEFERVRPEPAHRRPASLSSPLPARVRELPGTWTQAPLHGPHPAPVPSERQTAASVPSWPELPRTEGLEDAAAQAGPGLAAQLWQADDRPDALTAAQRRS